MVDEDTLAAVLSDFARTLITDFPIQGILDHLVVRIVDVLSVTRSGRHADLPRPGAALRGGVERGCPELRAVADRTR